MISTKLVSVIRDMISSIRREYYSHNIRAIDSMVYLTYRCTSQCKTCNIWKRSETSGVELEWEDWNNILCRLRDYGIKTLEIFGGDALLRKDLIFDVIRFCHDNGIATYFPTNSILLDKETAVKLARAGLGTIYISLDDIGQEHDAIRGKSGAFRSAKEAIENIVNARQGMANPHLIICATISNMNYDHLMDILDFLKDYPIDAVYPRVLSEFTMDNIDSSIVRGVRPEPYFTSTDGSTHVLTLGQVKTFREAVKNLKKNGKGIYVNYSAVDLAPDEAFTHAKFPIKRCMVCSTLVTIDPVGNVIPCPMYNKYHLGNIKEDRLEGIWGNEKHKEFVALQRKKKINLCRNCAMRSYYPLFTETLAYYFKRTFEIASSKF